MVCGDKDEEGEKESGRWKLRVREVKGNKRDWGVGGEEVGCGQTRIMGSVLVAGGLARMRMSGKDSWSGRGSVGVDSFDFLAKRCDM